MYFVQWLFYQFRVILHERKRSQNTRTEFHTVYAQIFYTTYASDEGIIYVTNQTKYLKLQCFLYELYQGRRKSCAITENKIS